MTHSFSLSCSIVCTQHHQPLICSNTLSNSEHFSSLFFCQKSTLTQTTHTYRKNERERERDERRKNLCFIDDSQKKKEIENTCTSRLCIRIYNLSFQISCFDLVVERTFSSTKMVNNVNNLSSFNNCILATKKRQRKGP